MEGPLTRALRRAPPLILDGAMGTELQRRGLDTGLPLWSAGPLQRIPEAVLAIHSDYIAAGADIITTDTFRTTGRTFRRAGLPDTSAELTAQAVALCRQARGQFPGRNILIAGSMAPLEDCYRPDLVPPDEDLAREHQELAGRLASAGVDFLLLETMNCTREAAAACRAALGTGKEVVVSFLCNEEGNLYSGESLPEALGTISSLKPAACSVNCVAPAAVSSLLAAMRAATSLPIAVYANVGRAGGERREEEFLRSVDEEEYAALAVEWARSGAAIIGGCCGTTPAYIERLREILPQRHKVTKERM